VPVLELPPVRPLAHETAHQLRASAQLQAEVVTRIARERSVDAIYERYSLAGTAGARTAKALGVPLVMEVNAPLREETARYRMPRHIEAVLEAERTAFAASAQIFAVSAAVARWLEREGVEPARIAVMHNAPPDRTYPARGPLDPLAEVVVGFCGGLKPWHGIETLLRGFELALQQGARMRLEVLGTGPMAELLERTSLPPDRLLALGQVPHAAALETLERWDVGVAPFTDITGFWFSPLKLFEYMAAGICPVVTDVGELASIVRGGEAGVVVAPDDPAALAAALGDLDRDRARIRQLGEQAREAALALPSWSDNARRVVDALSVGAPR
jgi:glycosyltransferase involved in cell wall biosynthesis